MIVAIAVVAIVVVSIGACILLSEKPQREVLALRDDQLVGLNILQSVYAKLEHLGAGKDMEYQNARTIVLMAMDRVRQS